MTTSANDYADLIDRITAFTKRSKETIERPTAVAQEEARALILEATAIIKEVMALPRTPELRAAMAEAMKAFQANRVDKNKLT